MALIILVACTNFIVVEKQDQEIQKLLNHTTNIGVKLMYRLVSKWALKSLQTLLSDLK